MSRPQTKDEQIEDERCCPHCGRPGNPALIELDDEDPSCGYRATVVKCEACVGE